MNTRVRTSRRRFLQTAATASAALAMPAIVPARVIGENPPSEQIVIAHIGLGWRGMELMRQTFRNPSVRIAAICDCDMSFLMKRLQFLDDQYVIDRPWIQGEGWDCVHAPTPEGGVDPYLDYRKVLDRPDIDAVVIATPDHWHARMFIDALDAGKDVYGEKPLSLTINQGRKVVRKVHETGRVFQTGSQQRSGDFRYFRPAAEFIRNGRIGEVKSARIVIGGTNVVTPVPDEPVPPGMNWEWWLGPAPLVPYNRLRSHVHFRWWWDYSGGQVTDLGVHHADIVQWALDMDGKGPRYIEGTGKEADGAYETFSDFNLKLTYDNGTELTIQNGPGFDLFFEGTKGNLFVNRDRMNSDPAEITQEPLRSDETPLQNSPNHMRNFLECVKSRETPITPADVGHTSGAVCHLANIAGMLGRKLEWDWEREVFVDDPEANTYLERPERAPYQT